MSRADLLKLAIRLRARGYRRPPPRSSEFGDAPLILTEQGEPIITEDHIPSGDDIAIVQES